MKIVTGANDSLFYPRGRLVVCRVVAGLFLLCSCQFAYIATADDKGPQKKSPPKKSVESPFEVDLRMDIPIIVVSGAIWMIPSFFDGENNEDRCDPICDPNEVNQFDRLTISNQSIPARTAADTLAVAIPLAATFASFLSLGPYGGRGLLEDLIMMGEAVALAGAFTSVAKHAVGRPRPYMYNGDIDESYRRNDQGDYLSFFSGHTTTAFAVSTSFAYIFSARYPENPLRWLVWTLAIGSGVTMGMLRVQSGDHFWTDVITGAVVGTAFGIAVPALHRRRPTNKDGKLTMNVSFSLTYAGLHGSF